MAAFDDINELVTYLPRQARGRHFNHDTVLGGTLPELLQPKCISDGNATKQGLDLPTAPAKI